MFTFHYDWQNLQWNVFHEVNGFQEYVCSFRDVIDAIDFCASENALLVGGGMMSIHSRKNRIGEGWLMFLEWAARLVEKLFRQGD